ncbi:MAG: TonB-dependent receptor [Acidobacteria bacterium]|nr:TonB-dependent receptor [Acidobacteriota bacterium]
MLLFLLAFALTGKVVDVSGAPVPNAKVQVRNAWQAQVASAVSGADGRFHIDSLTAGAYLVRVERDGFATWQGKADPSTSDLTITLSLSPVSSEVTVSAEAGEASLTLEIPQRTSIVGRDLLDEQAVKTLSEAVAGVEGVSEQRTAPAMSSIFIRGLTGRNVSAYRDGIRYTTSAQRGGVSTFQNLVDSSGLESLELLRGANSGQYGSDSTGGAINMVSKVPDFNAARRFDMRGATFYESAASAFGAELSPQYSTDKFALLANIAARRINSIRTAHGLDSHAAVTRFLGLPSDILGDRLPDTAFTQYGGSLHAQIRLSNSSHLIGHYERSQQDGAKRYDQLLGGDGNLIADLRNLMLDFGYLRYQHFGTGPFQHLSLSGSFNTQREERVNQGGQGNPRSSITHQYERMNVWGVQGTAERRQRDHTITIGGDTYWEGTVAPAFTVNPVTNVTTLSRPRIPDGATYLNYGLFVQELWEPERARRVRVSGALRFGGASYESLASNSPLVGGRPLWPNDSMSTHALSGRAGITFRAAQALVFHSNYSRGFRAPNITDLGTIGVQGNGNYESSYSGVAGMGGEVGDRADDKAVTTGKPVAPLESEFSDNVDYGATWTGGKLRVGINGFWSQLTNTTVSQTLILPQGAVGKPLGDQTISRQLPTGAVYVPAATNPVLVRANLGGARLRGFEQSLRWKIANGWTVNQTWTAVRAADQETGLPPDIEPGIPAQGGRLGLLYSPERHRIWVEAYMDAADRQDSLSSLTLSDRRSGAARSRTNIANFFNNGAVVRGLVSNGILLPTGETLAQVQQRVLGNAVSAPMFTAIPGYAIFGARIGAPLSSKLDVMLDLSNLTDHTYRGIGWGIDGTGRAALVKLRWHL